MRFKILLGLSVALLFSGCANNNAPHHIPYGETAACKAAVYKAEQRKIVGSKEYIAYHKRLKAVKLKRKKDQKNPQYIARMNKINKQHKINESYVRQQQKLNNDPRVIAARIQANATMQSAYMQQQQMQSMQRQQRNQNMQIQNQMMYNQIMPKTYRVNVHHYGY